jgi:uncharacterized protein YbjQ (UPF0145 family)
MQKNRIKVTTTSKFENAEIIEYLEPISAHIVVGMNIFKDFLGGITDVFGGNSSTYENTLTLINENVINLLRQKAYSFGANSVVGLRIDNDEIGAQGKSMMMVTATGTAVITKFPEKSLKIKNDKKFNEITNETLIKLLQRKEYIEKSVGNKLNLDDRFWDFVKKEKLGELANYIINHLENIASKSDFPSIDLLKTLKPQTIEYFRSIDNNIAIETLYSKLNTELTTKVRGEISDIIIMSNLIDYDRILTLLDNEDFLIQKNGLQICSNNKLNYESSDIEKIKKIINCIETKFNKRGKITLKKKMLSSKEVEIWLCECGKENNMIDIYCSKCYNDILGFYEKELKPERIQNNLKNIIAVLIKILK